MVEWLLIILMLVLSGFFSGTEIAYVSANRLKLEIRARKNNFGARHLEYFLRNPESFLSTTLIGNNIVNVLYELIKHKYKRKNNISEKNGKIIL